MRKYLEIFVYILAILLLVTAAYSPPPAPSTRRLVVVTRIQGEIGMPYEKKISDDLAYASRAGADLVVLTLDTPGGSLDSVKSIAQMIESSEVPVAAFVFPRGATAWSGGSSYSSQPMWPPWRAAPA